MLELGLGFLITIISLLIGYSLGKYQRAIPERTQQQINQIFARTVKPRSDVGAVARPTAQDNYYRDNPQAKIEDEETAKALGALNE